MANEKGDLTPEESKELSQITGFLLEIMLQHLAFRLALVEAGVLTHEQIRSQVQRLNTIPAVQKLRIAYGTPTQVLDEVLKDYEGTVQ
jgi:hypothetical protein